MTSLAHGNSTLAVEVTNISSFGIWIFIRGKEHFMSYDEFPWFKDQTVKSIVNVEEPTQGHLFWPDLDIDLSEESIEFPERFPLKAV
ncbi:MAG: DUF2442 domain-containing protein [Gammaproteobacteria bacterium]|nr:DUF2442 domain-containing protein [Gammaproteobacteria bacterium]